MIQNQLTNIETLTNSNYSHQKNVIKKKFESSVKGRQYSNLSQLLLLKYDNSGNVRSHVYVCFESNLVDVPSNSWWLDFGATVYILNYPQGFISRRPTRPEEQVFSGDARRLFIEFIGIFFTWS
ncbi:hypothetical protein GIB67_033202 [Kingdonia uniflora]|uniref:Uncharacterized protein n=1 Tax=Kingdonia uniflora TaxID=39325 RepID=A0A7J7MPB8_9MAGN|nr:hypothetical protein GIB67_033202 [Kingdonia uniflora]